jgi:hypothetical protein
MKWGIGIGREILEQALAVTGAKPKKKAAGR